MNYLKYLLLIIVISVSFSIFVETTISAGRGDGKASPPVTLTDPLDGKGKNPNELIGTIITAILGVVGSLALLMFIFGGLTWMTAAGSKEKIQKGKDILVWSTIGLVVIFMSYSIVKFVLKDIIAGG